MTKLTQLIDCQLVIKSISSKKLKLNVQFEQKYEKEDVALLDFIICEEMSKNSAFLKMLELGWEKVYEKKFSDLRVTFVWRCCR